jgi:hypothetical protein
MVLVQVMRGMNVAARRLQRMLRRERLVDTHESRRTSTQIRGGKCQGDKNSRVWVRNVSTGGFRRSSKWKT